MISDYLGYPIWYVKNKLGNEALAKYSLIYLNSDKAASEGDFRIIKITDACLYVAFFKEEIKKENSIDG